MCKQCTYDVRMGRDDFHSQLERAINSLERKAAVERIAELTAARESVEQALRDAMAEASLQGHSLRDIASVAGVAPNSVRPALARSAILASYATPEGVVDAQGLARAKYDQASAEPSTPLRFTRRKRASE